MAARVPKGQAVEPIEQWLDANFHSASDDDGFEIKVKPGLKTYPAPKGMLAWTKLAAVISRRRRYFSATICA